MVLWFTSSFGIKIVTGLGGIVLDFILRERWTFWPRVEGGAQPSFHGGRIEVAANTKNDVVGMNVFTVPVDQVLARDRRDGCILGNAA